MLEFFVPAATPPDVVVVHDAVRLFVTNELATKVVLSAKQHGVSICHDNGQAIQNALSAKLKKSFPSFPSFKAWFKS